MTKFDNNLPLFVLLAKKDELPKEKIVSEKETKDKCFDFGTTPTDLRYSLYKHISTFGR